MEDGFELLEEKVRKAAELVGRLRKANKKLEEEIAELRPQLEEAEQKLAELEKERSTSAEDQKKLDAMKGEIKTLRGEREQIRTRIGRLVELLEGLD